MDAGGYSKPFVKAELKEKSRQLLTNFNHQNTSPSMTIKEEKEARKKYISKVYSLIKEADLVSPESVTIGLCRYGKPVNGQVVLDEGKSGGYIIGKELGLSMDQVDAIVYHYVNKGYFGSFIGMGSFYFTSEGIEYVENLDEPNELLSLNFLQVETINGGNIQVQQGSNQSNQTQNISISQADFRAFYEAMKKDISTKNLSEDVKEELLSELDYAKRQNGKGKNISPQMDGIGQLIKDIGIGVFTNLAAAPIFEIVKPMLGL